MNYKTQLAAIGGGLSSVAMLYAMGKASVYYVDTGHKAFKFNKITGVRPTTFKEGWHLKTPWLEKAVIYNVKSQPTKIESTTGSMGKYNHILTSFKHTSSKSKLPSECCTDLISQSCRRYTDISAKITTRECCLRLSTRC